MPISRSRRESGLWVPRKYGGSAPAPVDMAAYRNSLVAGSFFPNAQTVGIYTPTSEMTVVTGNRTYGTADNGRTIENTVFAGLVVINAVGMTFRNCLFLGPQLAIGTKQSYGGVLVDDGSGIFFYDCTFEPTIRRAPALYGRKFTAVRCDIRYAEDGVRANSEDIPGARTDVELRGVWIHDLVCWEDTDFNDGVTHNDGIQTERGKGLKLIGIRNEAFLTDKWGQMLDFDVNYPGTHHVQGAALMINHNTNAGADRPDEIVIEGGWWNGGGVAINNSSGGNLTAASAVRNVHVGYDMRNGNDRFLFGFNSSPIAYTGNVRWGGSPAWVHGVIGAGPSYTPTGLADTKDPWDSSVPFTARY